MAAVFSALFWQFGKKLIFFLSIIIGITLSKLLCIVSLTLVICRHLQGVKTVPHTEKTGVELCKSKPHISAWMRKVRAMLDIKKTYQVQRSAINLVSAWSQANLFAGTQHLSAFFSSVNTQSTMDMWDLNPLMWLDIVKVLNVSLHS